MTDKTREMVDRCHIATYSAWDAEERMAKLKAMLWTASSDWEHERLKPLYDRAAALLDQQRGIRTKLLLLGADIGGADG